MAFPTTMTVVFLATFSQGRDRTYISSGGNIYFVGRKSTDGTTLSVQKATDPTDSFTEIATLSNTFTRMGIGTFQDGDDIHIATQDNNDVLLYHVFSMSSDTFTTSNQAVTSAVGTNIDADKCISISLETGGDQILMYQGASDNDMGQKERVDYAYKTGGSWTVDQAVDDGGAINFFMQGLVRGEANKFFLQYKDDTNADMDFKTVQDVDGTLSSVTEAGNNPGPDNFSGIQPIYYDDAGVERIYAGWEQGQARAVPINDGSVGTLLQISLGAINTNGEFSIFSFAVDEKTAWVLFAKEGNDIYSDSNEDEGGWGTDTEELDGITCNLITSNIYQRGSDIVLAYVYDDGGTIKYNEKVLRTVVSITPDMWHPGWRQPYPHKKELIPY